jgi:Uma2 family endonuclease
MGHAQPLIRLDFDAYLLWEEQQSEKHEYYAGEVFAMVGARKSHVTVALNLASAFKAHLRGGPCRVYMSDMKLRVAAADASFYPDVMVTCDARDHAAERYLEHPLLVVEVLSEATAAFDRGDKFAAYRRLPSLREYAVVDIDARRVECFRRDAADRWVLFEFTGDADCEFATIGLTMPLAAVFEDVAPGATEAGSTG